MDGNINIVISSVVILFVLIFLGFFIGKKGIIRKDCAPDLSNFILKVTMPVTVFCSIAGQSDLSLLSSIWQIMIMALIFHLASGVIGLILVRILKVPDREQGIWIFNCMFSNNGFMGFPLGLAIWGNKGLFLMSVANVVSNFLIFSVGLKMLTKGYPIKEKINLKKMIVNNINIAVVLGFVFYIGQIPMPQGVSSLLDYLSQITAGLSMIVVGLSLSRMEIRDVFRSGRMFVLSAMRLLGIPLLCILVMNLIPLKTDPMLKAILILMAALPAASSQTILAEQYGTNTRDAGRAIFITTLFCVITIPISMAFVV